MTFKIVYIDAADEHFSITATVEGFTTLKHAEVYAANHACLLSAQTRKFMYVANITEINGDPNKLNFVCNCHPSYWSEGTKVVQN